MTAPYQPSRSLWARVKRKAVQAYAPHTTQIARKRGAVCFTFDDAPRSAIEHGAGLLDSYGLKGVFYLCAGLTDATTHLGPMHSRADIDDLAEAGHEIACHTFDHRDLARTTQQDAIANIARNASTMAAWGMPVMRHFAYPYGETHFALKRTLGERFATARGVVGGVNVGRVDRMQLRAQRLYGEDSFSACVRVMNAAKDHSGLAIIFTHDVQDKPTPYGCRPSLLDRAIKQAIALDLDIVTLSAALPPAQGDA